MNNRSKQSTRYYTRRSRRPALLGATAFASVIMLAFGGLLLVGLDTVSSQSRQLARVVQPEIAQPPEVSEETSSGGEESTKEANAKETNAKEANAEAESTETQGAEAGSSEAGNKDEGSGGQQESKEKGPEQANSGEQGKNKDQSPEQSQNKDQAREQKQQKQEEPDPPAPSVPTMGMTIPRLDMWGDTVYNSGSLQTMHQGAIKLPPTGFPWQQNANTYISAHRIGFPGTQSYNQFYSLPAMQQGDAVYLTDANGTTYEYRVTDKFAVKPWENWVTEPQPGGDMVTLQTCVHSLDPSTWWDITPQLMQAGPDSARLVVQAEKVDTIPAG